MTFSLLTRSFGAFTELVVQNTRSGESFSVLPAHGAVVHSLLLRRGEQLISLLDTPASSEALLADETYASALLFPYPSRLPEGRYTFEGHAYTMAANENGETNAIHGFVAGQPFELFDQRLNEQNGELTLRYRYEGANEGYPFPFDLRITYGLAADGVFTVRYAVQNTGSRGCPVAFGWHPYFRFGEEAIDVLTIDLPARQRVRLNEEMMPAGTEAFDQQGALRLDGQELDAVFIVDESAETVLRSERQQLSLHLRQDAAFPYLVVYTPLHRRSIAIEPWTANVNALNNGEGLVVLEPGETTGGTAQLWLR